MRRIKQCFCTAFPLFVIVLLSTCLFVWRWIKSFLESKVKKEKAEEVESLSISSAGDEVLAGLVSTVESEDKAMGAELEADDIKAALIADKDISAVLVPSVEPEDKVTGEEIEISAIEAAPIEDKDISAVLVPGVEPEDKVTGEEIETNAIKAAPIEDKDILARLVSTVESEDKTMEKTVEAQDDVVAQDVAEAYCAKCRQKRTIQGVREVTTKKGRSAIEGICSVCGTKVFRFTARGKETLSEK
jgi:hypothetical protein